MILPLKIPARQQQIWQHEGAMQMLWLVSFPWNKKYTKPWLAVQFYIKLETAIIIIIIIDYSEEQTLSLTREACQMKHWLELALNWPTKLHFSIWCKFKFPQWQKKTIQTWQNEDVQQHYHDETTENTLIISSLVNWKTKRRKIPDRIWNVSQYWR